MFKLLADYVYNNCLQCIVSGVERATTKQIIPYDIAPHTPLQGDRYGNMRFLSIFSLFLQFTCTHVGYVYSNDQATHTR